MTRKFLTTENLQDSNNNSDKLTTNIFIENQMFNTKFCVAYDINRLYNYMKDNIKFTKFHKDKQGKTLVLRNYIFAFNIMISTQFHACFNHPTIFGNIYYQSLEKYSRYLCKNKILESKYRNFMKRGCSPIKNFNLLLETSVNIIYLALKEENSPKLNTFLVKLGWYIEFKLIDGKNSNNIDSKICKKSMKTLYDLVYYVFLTNNTENFTVVNIVLDLTQTFHIIIEKYGVDMNAFQNHFQLFFSLDQFKYEMLKIWESTHKKKFKFVFLALFEKDIFKKMTFCLFNKNFYNFILTTKVIEQLDKCQDIFNALMINFYDLLTSKCDLETYLIRLTDVIFDLGQENNIKSIDNAHLLFKSEFTGFFTCIETQKSINMMNKELSGIYIYRI